jgi:hypothetical protein
MSDILLYYRRPDPTTWVYLSSFLTIGLFFVFHRFWSIRNLDIVLLILLAPGLLMVLEGIDRQLLELESEAVASRSLNSRPDAPSSHGDASSDAREPIPPETQLDAAATVLALSPIAALVQVGDGATVDAKDSAAQAAQSPAGGDAETDTDEVDPAATIEPVRDDQETSATSQGEDADSESSETYTPGQIQRLGFVSLFVIQAFILLRLLLDPLMSRRPLLEPNLTIGGLNFIGISLFVFIMANVLNSTPRIQVTQGPELGPGYALMNMLPAIPTRPVSDALGGVAPPTDGEMDASQARLTMIAKVLAIIAHMAIVTGIVLIGSRHFGHLRAGVGCATLYLLLPYTAQMTGRVDHAIPAALLLWALLLYRKPFGAGIFLGLACGLVYYPLFLLPLWFSFYWKKGARRFGVGVVAMLALLMLLLSFADAQSLVDHLRRMFGLFSPFKEAHELRGFWELGLNPIWRLPVIVGFVILSVFFAIWPAQKNLGVLISGSAAIMVAAQFWHGYGGGLYIAWFLPLLLLTIFRPNLQDRVATKVVDGPRISPVNRPDLLEVEAA